jgi:hypothetical protein
LAIHEPAGDSDDASALSIDRSAPERQPLGSNLSSLSSSQARARVLEGLIHGPVRPTECGLGFVQHNMLDSHHAPAVVNLRGWVRSRTFCLRRPGPAGGTHVRMSRKVSALVAQPACIAGVRVTGPKRRLACGLMKL